MHSTLQPSPCARPRASFISTLHLDKLFVTEHAAEEEASVAVELNAVPARTLRKRPADGSSTLRRCLTAGLLLKCNLRKWELATVSADSGDEESDDDEAKDAAGGASSPVFPQRMKRRRTSETSADGWGFFCDVEGCGLSSCVEEIMKKRAKFTSCLASR